MTIRGLKGYSGNVVQGVGRPMNSSIGYNGKAPKAPYIINYNRNSVSIHKGQSVLRKLLGR